MLDAKAVKRKHGLQHVTNEDQAVELANRLLHFVDPATRQPLFVACERMKEKTAGYHTLRALDGDKPHVGTRPFDRGESGRYFWTYAGNQTWNRVKLGLLVGAIFAVCLFPLWPDVMRTIIWYISVTLLLALLGITLSQFVAYA